LLIMRVRTRHGALCLLVCSAWTCIAFALQGSLSSPGETRATRAQRWPERGRALAVHSAAERERILQSLALADLLALGRKNLAGLGIYKARVTREERVEDRLYGPDWVEVTVREEPRAVRLDFVAGARKGRRALYDARSRPREMLARESGVLGLFSMWLPIDSPLAHRDTNHDITEVGFGAMIDIMQAEQTKAATAGGYARADEGFDARGLYCMLLTAPPGARGLSARKLRYCVEETSFLPMRVEVFDERGRREYVEYHDLRVRQPLGDDYFTAKAAGL
jgi:hypothetical protein